MPHQGSRANAVASLLVPCSFAIVAFVLLYVFFLSHIWGDQAFLLYAAKQVLAGVALDGPRLVETNPPLIVWLSTIPVAIAGVLHAQPAYTLQAMVALVLLGSAAWSYRLLRRGENAVAPGILAAVLMAAATAIQPALFGQREQIFVALVCPYLVAVASGAVRSLPAPERALLGMAAGLAVCIKPQQVLTLLAFELFAVLLRRSLRHVLSVECLAAALTGVVYVAVVWRFTPYLTSLVGLLRDTYWALGSRSFAQLLRGEERNVTLAVVFGWVLWAVVRKRLPQPQLPGFLLAAATGALAAVYVQHTGWGYQSFPASALATVGIVFTALQYVGSRAGEPIRYVPPHPAVWAVLVLLLAGGLGATAVKVHRAARNDTSISADMERYPPGMVVYVFTTDMNHFGTVLDHKLVWGNRFAHLWMLPAVVQNEGLREHTDRPFKALGPARTQQLANLLRQDTAEDMAAWQPHYVYVQKCAADQCDVYNGPMNFIAWFSQSPDFARQWQHYHLQRSIPAFDIYERD